jgi:hypothetical protein
MDHNNHDHVHDQINIDNYKYHKIYNKFKKHFIKNDINLMLGIKFYQMAIQMKRGIFQDKIVFDNYKLYSYQFLLNMNN